MRIVLGCALAVLIAGVGLAADEKIDAKKLVGKWEPKDRKEKKEGESVVIEFTKGGEVAVTHSGRGNDVKFGGTYKVEGDKLTTTMKLGGDERSQTQTIVKLTDAELVVKNEKGREEALVRIKGEEKK